MKANAPERLYLSETIYSTYLYQVPDPDDESAVEYTRTEAFVKKACEYFRRGLEDVKVIDDYRNIAVRGIQASYTSVEEFIEDFRKYMEGE